MWGISSRLLPQSAAVYFVWLYIVFNCASVKNCVHVSFWTMVSPDMRPRVVLQDHVLALFSVLLRNFHTILHSGCINLLSHQSCGKFPFFHMLIICRFFDDCHSDWCEGIPNCSFDFHFSNNYQCWVFSHAFGPLYVFFGEMSVLIFCTFIDWAVCFLLLSWMNCLYIL